MNPHLGRTRIRSALAELLPRDATAQAFTLADLFGNDLDRYAELIVAPAQQAAGFMTRGEDLQFYQRARIALMEFGFGPQALELHGALSTWFEHRRAFLKLEWRRTEAGVEPLAACYFRRRPPVASALARLAALGAGSAAVAHAEEMARALAKGSIHFVSVAFQPGRPPYYKLYFSQFADPADPAAATARVDRVFDLFGVGGLVREHWRELHDATVGPGEQTFFVSMSSGGDGPRPSFKIDYPSVSPMRASEWLPVAERRAVVLEIERTCALAGVRALSFLGVRFTPGEPAPVLKYYADVRRPDAT
ncbi:MAG TPA: hypothetical protein VH877_27740 [Polyangia bacterium]|jgi:hypothetical protein|nr:hypothetical protein [Polyangia bacterium]